MAEGDRQEDALQARIGLPHLADPLSSQHGGIAQALVARLGEGSASILVSTCACYAAMKPALTTQTARSAGLERTTFRAEHLRA